MTQEQPANAQDPLGPTRADAIHTGVKVGVASIPILGGLFAELFDAIIAPPISKRRDALLIAVYDGLKALEKQIAGFRLDDLAQNEAFISTFMEVMPIAIRNHRQEKLKALRNAVLNAALPTAPDDNRQKMFTQWLDELTVWHMQVLMLFERPVFANINLDRPDWFKFGSVLSELKDVIAGTYPEIAAQPVTVYIQLLNDLHSRGLIANLFPEVDMLTKIERSPRLTILGKAFLEFIRSPLDEDSDRK